ncbi:hypothetical protein ACWEQ1_22885 [Streptomyces nodosus]
MRSPLRATATFALAAVAAFATGCSSPDTWSQPHPAPSPVGTLGDGFTDPSAPPSPEATITPRPGSWDGVHPPKDYRVVLLSSGDDRPTRTLVTAVEDWARTEHVSLRTVTPDTPSDPIPAIVRALDMHPDLIISAGDELIDSLATVSASHLSQQFLVLGAELPEPTHNVTSANWPGATFRGEDLVTSTAYDARSFTPRRCAEAVRAGTAAVLNHLTGIVVQLDAP